MLECVPLSESEDDSFAHFVFSFFFLISHAVAALCPLKHTSVSSLSSHILIVWSYQAPPFSPQHPLQPFLSPDSLALRDRQTGTRAWSACHKLGGATGCQAETSTSGGNKVLTPLLTFRGCPSPSHPHLLSFLRSSPLSPNSPACRSPETEKKKNSPLSLEENRKITNICIFFPVPLGAYQYAAWQCGLLSHSRNYPSVFMFFPFPLWTPAALSVNLSAFRTRPRSHSETLQTRTPIMTCVAEYANGLWHNAWLATVMHSQKLVPLSHGNHLE